MKTLLNIFTKTPKYHYNEEPANELCLVAWHGYKLRTVSSCGLRKLMKRGGKVCRKQSYRELSEGVEGEGDRKEKEVRKRSTEWTGMNLNAKYQ